jgi:hypothetical protein
MVQRVFDPAMKSNVSREKCCRVGFFGSFLPTKKERKKIVTLSIENIPLKLFSLKGLFCYFSCPSRKVKEKNYIRMYKICYYFDAVLLGEVEKADH